MEAIPTVKLADGFTIPMIGYGLGTANIKGKSEKEFRQDTVDYTVMAIKTGYYHLDGAEYYQNESELGTAIKASGIPRDHLFITSKASCLPGDTIEISLKRSLAALDISHVDLYLIHNPNWGWANGPEDLQKKWAEMEGVREAGLTRSIGVSNFSPEQMEAILKTAKSKPVVNQVRYNPLCQYDEGYLDFHRKHGITVEAFGPLGAVRSVGGPVQEVYERLSAKYGVGVGDVALRWCLDQGVVAITTSKSEERLKGYLKTLPSFKLTEEEIKEIADAGRKK